MSDILKIRGIVLKETAVGEADKFITVLAKDYGKISVSVNGAKRVRKGLSAGTSLFSYSDFYISKVRKRMYLNQAETIETFYNLRNDLSLFSYGSYFIEITDKLLFENMPANNIMLLLLRTLNALLKNKIPIKLISSIFELKILEYNGYKPETNVCIKCGRETESNFYITKEGTICEKCLTKNSFHKKLNETLLYTIKYIFTSSPDKLYNFKIPIKEINAISNLSRHLLLINFNLKLKSLKFIQEIESLT